MENDKFFELIEDFVTESGVSKDKVYEILEAGIAAGYKKQHKVQRQITVKTIPEKRLIRIFTLMHVVEKDEDVQDPNVEFSLEEAKLLKPNIKVGDPILEEIFLEDFTRIAAQTAKQVIFQRLNELKQEKILAEMNEKEGEILMAIIRRVEGETVFVEMAGNQMEGVMMPRDQIPGERYDIGNNIKVYVKFVRDNQKGGSQVVVSRSIASFVKRLFELEVPEIKAGLITVKGIVRDAGNRTKMAVASTDASIIDPVGSCIGPKGSRINTIIQELNGEKIDIIQYSEDVGEYIAMALSPAKVIAVQVNNEQKTARAIVPDEKLSLAIGKAGQNVRLAAKLTGWKIDVNPYSSILTEFGQGFGPSLEGDEQ